jgi:ATP-dependent RNA helicase DOB1
VDFKDCVVNNVHSNPSLENIFKEKSELKKSINASIENVKKLRKLVLSDELNKMKRVMRRIEFIDKEENVLKKGQIACIISVTDSLLLTEMLFNGHFNEIEASLLCAMLSCFVSNEGSKSETKLIKNALLQKAL